MTTENSRTGKMAKMAGHMALGLILAVTFALIFGYAVMASWNAVIPGLFSLAAIDYWQAVALLVLGRILFGSFSHKGHRHGGRYRPRFGRHHKCAAPTEDRSAELYTAWWDSEGEAAFKAYLARQ